jgi:hypothetical protein
MEVDMTRTARSEDRVARIGRRGPAPWLVLIAEMGAVADRAMRKWQLVPSHGAALLLAVLLATACGGPVPPDSTQTCVDPPESAKSPFEEPSPPDDGTTVTYLMVNDFKVAVVELEIDAANPGGFAGVFTTAGVDAFCLVPQDLSRVGELVDVTFRAQGLVEAGPETAGVLVSEASASVSFRATPAEPFLQLTYLRGQDGEGGFVAYDDLVTRKVQLGSWARVGVFAEIRLHAFDGSEGVARARAQVSFDKVEAGGVGVPLGSIQTASGTD